MLTKKIFWMMLIITVVISQQDKPAQDSATVKKDEGVDKAEPPADKSAASPPAEGEENAKEGPDPFACNLNNIKSYGLEGQKFSQSLMMIMMPQVKESCCT